MSIWVAIIIAAVVGFGISALLGLVVIPWLHKLKYGQTILDIGPAWHKSKQGTPTMGGIIFIAGTVISVVLTALIYHLSGGNLKESGDLLGSDTVLIWAGVFLALGQAVVGFADDYIKVVKKRNLGLTAIQKTLGQIIVGFGYLLSLYLSHNTWTYIPFVGKWDMAESFYGIFFWIIGIIIVYGFSNAVNLTDGIDGLCGSVTMVTAVSLLVMAMLERFAGMSIYAAALAGACAGYLIWNHYPAKVFMGDTGSLFLGGAVIALAFGIHCPFILFIIGLVYICETGSVMIQVSYYKLTKKPDENGNLVGKRIFKMTPIHHHFEMSGWKENKIVAVFSTVAVIAGAAGVLLMYFGCYNFFAAA